MKVGVIGGGIIGVTTALCLKESEESSNYDVTIVTEKITPETTGDGAAGIWGLYLVQATPEQKRRWSLETHNFIENLWNSPIGGQVGISLVSFTRLNLNEEDTLEWKDVVYGFREISKDELKQFGRLEGEHKKGYEFITYTLEPVKFLPFAMNKFNDLGGKIVSGRRVRSLSEICDEFDFDVVINCTGVEARHLVNDHLVQPLRGQVIRVKAPWMKRVILDDFDDGNYVIPNQDSLVLGGTHQSGNWNTQPDPKDSEFIWKGSHKLVPQLNGADRIQDWVGLRPGREQVRIEREKLTSKNGVIREVIHNYGHGGSGITVCWGCAKDVYNIFKEIEKEILSKKTVSHL